MPNFLLKEDAGFLLQESGSKIILDEIVGGSGFNAVARTKPNILAQTPFGSFKPVATIGYAWLTWVASSVPGFSHYEIFRGGQNGGTIAKISNETVTWFADFTLPRNKPAQYLIRSVRTDGAATAFEAFPLVTVPMAKCVVTLANDAVPDQCFACEDAGPYDSAFSAEDKVVLRDIFGRPKPVGFRPGEEGGDVFSRTLYVAGIGANLGGDPSGRVLFQPVLTLLRNFTLPYVALCDATGWTWLTTPKVTSTRQADPGGLYTATVAFAETAGVASPVETDVPWHF